MDINNVVKEEVINKIIGEITFTDAEIKSAAKDIKRKMMEECSQYMINNIDSVLDDNDKIWKAFYKHTEAEILRLFK